MRGYNVISKGNGEVLFENFISIKQYLVVKKKGKKYLLVKLSNDRTDAVSSVTLSIKQYDAKNDVLKKSETPIENLNRKGVFVPKMPIELAENCVSVDVSVSEAYYGDYHYAVKGGELIVTYEKPDHLGLTEAELQRRTGGVQYYVSGREFRVPKSIIFTSLGILAGAFVFTAAQLSLFQSNEDEFILSNVQYEFTTANKKDGPVMVTGYNGEKFGNSAGDRRT